MSNLISNKSYLLCIRCGAELPLYGTITFECSCGGLYEVKHDWDFLADITSKKLKATFDERTKPGPDPRRRSGIWRFHELIMPSLPVSDIITLGEGILPMWPAGKALHEWIGGDLDLWILPEGLTTTGSFKDFGGTVATSVAKKSGVDAFVCASTGDTSAMAAAYAAAAGMKCIVILPRDYVTPVQMAQPIVNGATVITLPGSFDDCLEVVRELVRQGRAFPINSINPTRIEGHQASVFLSAQFFGWSLPDWFVVPLGNGSNTSSIGKGLNTLKGFNLVQGESRILSVQSEAANPLASSWARAGGMSERNDIFLDVWEKAYRPQKDLGETTATAARIGNPASWEKVMRAIMENDGIVLTSQERLLNEAVMVAGKDGYFVCPQTGTALAGLRQAVGQGDVKKGSRVIVVSTATGLKFPNVPEKYGAQDVIATKTCELEEVAQAAGV